MSRLLQTRGIGHTFPYQTAQTIRANASSLAFHIQPRFNKTTLFIRRTFVIDGHHERSHFH